MLKCDHPSYYLQKFPVLYARAHSFFGWFASTRLYLPQHTVKNDAFPLQPHFLKTGKYMKNTMKKDNKNKLTQGIYCQKMV